MIKKIFGWSMGLLLLSHTANASEDTLAPEQLHRGMVGQAYTTTTGNVMTSFNVEIIGVVPAGKGAPPQILARAYGGIIPSTNGVIHGMSGSPVYVNGKLIGAIARGVGNDVLPYKFYITPITAMEEILKYPDQMAGVNKIGVPPIKILPVKAQKANQEKEEKALQEQVALTLGKTVEEIFGKEAPPVEESLKLLEQHKTSSMEDSSNLVKGWQRFVAQLKDKLGLEDKLEDELAQEAKKAKTPEEIKIDISAPRDISEVQESIPVSNMMVVKDTADITDTESEDTAVKAEAEKDNKEADNKVPVDAKADVNDKGNEDKTEVQDVKEESKNNKEIIIPDAGKDLLPTTLIPEEEDNSLPITKKEEIKIDESQPVTVISPKELEEMLAKGAKGELLNKAVKVNKLRLQRINHNLAQSKPIFTSMGMEQGFISGFTPKAKEFLKRRIGAGDKSFAQEAGISEEDGSDVILNYPLKAGDPLGATVAYGDFSIGATGTVTKVQGDKVISFGHPMFFKGNVNYFMNTASVIDSAGGILDGIQVASMGKIIGRVNQDRYAGIGGILNSFPASVPVRVKVIDIDRQEVMNYGVKVAYDEDNLVSLVPAIVYGAMSRTADRELYGTAQIGFAIANNVNPRGVFARSNMYYDANDVGDATVAELTDALGYLVGNKERVSNIYDVKVEVRLSTRRRTATITSVTADKMEVKPGEIVTFNITVQPYRDGEKIITIPYLIPTDQPKGPMTFEVKGGGLVRVSELLAGEGDMVMAKDGSDEEETTLDKLNQLADQGRNNEIVVNPINDFNGEMDLGKAVEEAFKKSQALEKLSPQEQAELAKEKEVIHKTKYIVDNVRHITIQVVKKKK